MLWLDPQLEHAETCSNAAGTREHYGCVMKLAERPTDVAEIASTQMET